MRAALQTLWGGLMVIACEQPFQVPPWMLYCPAKYVGGGVLQTTTLILILFPSCHPGIRRHQDPLTPQGLRPWLSWSLYDSWTHPPQLRIPNMARLPDC